MPLDPRPSLKDVRLLHLSRTAFYDQTRMPLGPRPSLNDVCLLCLSRQVFCDQTRMPLDLDTRSRTIVLAVSLCFAVLVLRFDDTRFPLPLLIQIILWQFFVFLILAGLFKAFSDAALRRLAF